MDKLHTTPIDRVAARVIGKGVQYQPATKGESVDSETPLPVIPPPRLRSAGWADLTGSRIGRLQVVGLSAERGDRWVCRCDCGRYTLRTAKAVKNSENIQERCSHCRHLAFLKRDDERRRTGKDVDIRKF